MIGWVSQIADAPKALDSALGVAGGLVPEVAIGAGVLVAVAVVVRVVRGRRARRSRTEMVMVPSEGFDPPPEEIVRLAGQLARAQSSGSGVLMSAGGRSIRVSLVSAGEGQMAHVISGSSKIEGMLRRRPLGQVEARPAGEVLGTAGGQADEPSGEDVEADGGTTPGHTPGCGPAHGRSGGEAQSPGRRGSHGEPATDGRWACLTAPGSQQQGS